MAKNGKDINHTSHISRRVNFVRNGENCKMHKIEWCERGMKLARIATTNFGENDLNPRMKYIMVRLENGDRKLLQEGLQDTGYSMEKYSYMTILYLVEESKQSV